MLRLVSPTYSSVCMTDECLRIGSLKLLSLEEAVERRYLKPPLRDVYEAANLCLSLVLWFVFFSVLSKPLSTSALNARVLGMKT